jgi:hypothetical protein
VRRISEKWTKQQNCYMTEEEYWASEMRDSDLDTAADAGEYFLEESGFSVMPSQAEMQQMAQEGEIMLQEQRMAQEQQAFKYWPKQPKDLNEWLKRPPASEGGWVSENGGQV